jgi:hypothetical protein
MGMTAKRVYLKRFWDDGTVEEHDCKLIGTSGIDARDVPPPDTSVAGRRYSEEYVIEWKEPA